MRVIFSLAVMALLVGCADSARLARQVTYPENFKYLTRAELRTTMHGLWEQIRELDHALVEPVESAAVVRILDRLRDGATTLDAGPGNTNHPFFQDQLAGFQTQLARARLAALTRPPDYRPALAVVDACARCHTVSR